MKCIKNLLLFFFFSLSGCKEKLIKEELRPSEEINYVFNLSDTIKKGESIDGIIYYSSDLDTITNSFHDTINYRIVTFLLYEPLAENEKKIVLKDSLRIRDKKIEIKDLLFTKTGKYRITGLITDVVLMNYFDSSGKRDSFRYINKKQEVEKEVFVIE